MITASDPDGLATSAWHTWKVIITHYWRRILNTCCYARKCVVTHHSWLWGSETPWSLRHFQVLFLVKPLAVSQVSVLHVNQVSVPKLTSSRFNLAFIIFKVDSIPKKGEWSRSDCVRWGTTHHIPPSQKASDLKEVFSAGGTRIVRT